jgi:hypothetical protein
VNAVQKPSVAGACGDIVRERDLPAAQLLPTSMLDVHQGRLVAQVGERDLDLRCALSIRGDVPQGSPAIGVAPRP